MADASTLLVLLLANQGIKEATDAQVDMWAGYLSEDKDHEKEKRAIKEESRERKAQGLQSIQWLSKARRFKRLWAKSAKSWI